jgi:hypothetical protein
MRSLPNQVRYLEEGDRRGADRRCTDRRAPRRWLDPLFAATLVNQVAKPETIYSKGYVETTPRLRSGIVVNVRA